MQIKPTLSSVFVLGCLWPLGAQDTERTQMNSILDRLAKLEAQNEALRQEVAQLRKQLAPANVPVAETIEVHETRIRDLAQSKVEAASKLPIAITGTLLMNAFWNGRNNSGSINSATAAAVAGPHAAGLTFNQTILGIKFHSPQSVLGANINGFAMIDFFDSNARPGNPPTQQSRHLADYPRLRVASLEMAWKDTTVSVGQDKPLISPRDPTSFAQVGISPLTGAGNPWLWQPQVRLEHRLHPSDSLELKAQASIYQTAEEAAAVPAPFTDTLAPVRPGWQGRIQLKKMTAGESSWEIATGIHSSTTFVASAHVPSRAYTVDWLWAPTSRLNFTGLLFTGKNLAHMGALRQGFRVFGPGVVRPVATLGGWAQVSYAFHPRLTGNIYSGQLDDRNRDLNPDGVGKNFVFAGNLIYRIAPNVTISFEASQARTDYLRQGRRLKNHYDLALAYQF